MKNYISLLRPDQYVKNLFIYLPLFFALQMANYALLFKATIAFIAFCMVASAIYVFNDYHDLKEDRLHPVKKLRPLADGRISKIIAFILMGILLFCGVSVSYFLDIKMFYLIFVYLGLNIAYTLKLKHVAILDVFIIATGFVIRVFIGGAVTQVTIYPWIVVMTFLLSLLLAFSKRRDDLLVSLQTKNKIRKSIDGYNLSFINSVMMASAAITIVAYMMFTVSLESQLKFKTDKLYLTSVFVVLGIFRYMKIAFVENNTGSPSDILLRDRFIQLTILGWLVTFVLLIYL